MRRPISDDEDLQWWRDAIAGKRPIVTDEPHPGWYRRRLVKGGPEVPVRIWREQPIDPETGELCGDTYLCCDVDGRPSDPDEQWLWCCMSPQSETEYDYMLSLSRFAKRHDPREALATPKESIDLMRMPPPKFKPKSTRRQS